MKAVCKILFLVIAFLVAGNLSAAPPSHPVRPASPPAKVTSLADSLGFDLYENERLAILKRISFEKLRIANDFKSSNQQFFTLIDSVTDFAMRQPVTKEKRNIYLNRLELFLTNINRYYSDSYFKSGTYVAVLSYFPVMIEWDETEDLTANIKRYSAFTIKAARLIPNETSAEDFLVDYMNDNPDDVFRYAEEFDDRKFALRVLEKATKLAPESAKRYFTSGNSVSDLLKTCKDPYVKKSLEIYTRYGLRSRAYLLLDALVKNTMTLPVADSIGSHPDIMFNLQVGLSTKYDAPITFSSNKFLEMYSVDAMRKTNQEMLAAGATYGFESFKQHTPEEMFQLLSYGFKETTPKSFPGFFEMLRKKVESNPISSIMIASMDKEKLKDFVIFCYKNKLLDQLLALVDDGKKEYLLALTTIEEKEVPTPPVKTFTAQDYAAAGKPEDVSLKNVIPARPPKPVAPDTLIAVNALSPVNESKVAAQAKDDSRPTPVPVMVEAKIPPVRKQDSLTSVNPGSPVSETKTNGAKEDVQPITLQPEVIYSKAKRLPDTLSTVPATLPAVESKDLSGIKEDARPAQLPVTETKKVVPASKANELPVMSSAVPKPAPVVPKDVVPVPIAPEPVEPIKITLDERTLAIMGLKKNILQTIQHIPTFINKDYAEEILMYAAEKEPDELFKKINDFKGKFYCKKILEECVINAPVSLKRYLYNPHETVNYILVYSQNPLVKKIFEINPSLGYHSKPLLLLDDIAEGKLSVKDAITISTNPNDLFSTMVKIISRPKYVGRYSISHEMRDYSLRFIREINDKIATGAPQPFSSVESFGAPELYFLMLYGRDEVFTSTFNGLFNRFIQKLPRDNGEAFLASVNYDQFRDFLSLCANYGTLQEFLTKFSPEGKKKLLQSYVAKLENEKDNLSTVVLMAEAISNLTDNTLLTILQEAIKKEYERVRVGKDQIGVSLYGVLSSMISGNAKVEVAWYKKIAQQFKISPSTTLASSALFSDGPVCAEQMYFYDDEDGRSSFINFMNSYKNQNAWAIEDKNSYVRIYSKQQKSVEILANKPGSQENGMSAIDAYFKENKLSPKVIVHRGHSFHTESTLERIPATTRLLFIGSCGGFYKIPIAMENAPQAHIISTKQVGTKTVNDVMLYALNENIRTGKDIDWNEFWDKMRERLGNNQYFGDYVPPHKNLEAIFIRAYYKILGV